MNKQSKQEKLKALYGSHNFAYDFESASNGDTLSDFSKNDIVFQVLKKGLEFHSSIFSNKTFVREISELELDSNLNDYAILKEVLKWISQVEQKAQLSYDS